VGRYDKIPPGSLRRVHSLPESALLCPQAHRPRLEFTRGDERKVFSPQRRGHRYGVFICYEAVFADEVRQFARLGAEVLVNISDDGWYGDTSAPGST
jgi:apolipoprotein N-acyltransferase